MKLGLGPACVKGGLPRLLLASASPRRRELLGALGLTFEVMPSAFEEDASPAPGEMPNGFARRLALSKAKVVADQHPHALVLGADTIVVLEGRVLGKPASVAEADDMLRRLRGREHRVITGVALVAMNGDVLTVEHAETKVVFRRYSDDEMRDYITSGAPMDKAGAYGIQDTAFHPATSVEGCLFNVIGLPTCLVADMLARAGLPVHFSGPSPILTSPARGGPSKAQLEIGRGPLSDACRLVGCRLLRE